VIATTPFKKKGRRLSKKNDICMLI